MTDSPKEALESLDEPLRKAILRVIFAGARICLECHPTGRGVRTTSRVKRPTGNRPTGSPPPGNREAVRLLVQLTEHLQDIAAKLERFYAAQHELAATTPTETDASAQQLGVVRLALKMGLMDSCGRLLGKLGE